MQIRMLVFANQTTLQPSFGTKPDSSRAPRLLSIGSPTSETPSSPEKVSPLAYTHFREKPDILREVPDFSTDASILTVSPNRLRQQILLEPTFCVQPAVFGLSPGLSLASTYGAVPSVVPVQLCRFPPRALPPVDPSSPDPLPVTASLRHKVSTPSSLFPSHRNLC